MPNEVTTRCPIDRQSDQRDNHDCENRVTRQDREVDRPNETLTRKPRSPMIVMVGEIRSDKQPRSTQRKDLARAMRPDASGANETVASQQKEGTGAVQYRVQMR